jgi:iron complex outermembrane recepter protein
MKRKLQLLTALMFILSIGTFAQSPGKITGTIKDGGNQKIIDAASISLLKAKDSSLVKISLADKEGNFSFTAKPGIYLIMATSVGHTKVFSAPVNLTDESTVSVGTLQLLAETKALKEVAVNNKKPFIERKIDKTIINVDAMISNAGTTVLEVLEKSPGVSVDRDGNVSLQGKQGVIIMIDGKPAYLSGQALANLLKNMPSSSLEQIELMTNPSAKYDASGNSGIINIRTKKNKTIGFNGSLSVSYSQGLYSRTSNSLNLNYRKNKFNYFGNYSYSNWNNGEDLIILRNFKNLATKEIETIFDQESYMKNYGDFHNLKAGIDFYVSRKTTLGAVLSGYYNPSGEKGDNVTLLKDKNGTIDSSLHALSRASRTGSNFGVNLNFRHIFDSTGKEVTADVDYLEYEEGTTQRFVNQYFDANGSTRKPTNHLRGNLPSLVKIHSAKLDFTFPLKKQAKIEAGLKSSYVTTDNEAVYDNNSGAGWIADYGKTNHFIYKENINAAYVNANKQMKKWGVQAGLRVEHTHAKGHQLGNSVRRDSSFTRDYINIFPTMYISYQANKTNTFAVNYGRRIDRPAYQDLNPFYYFLDDYTYQVGNTLLKPQFTNFVELSHTFKGFLTTTLNYSSTTDMATDVLDQVAAERKTFVRKDNIASMKNISLAVSLNKPVTKFWTMSLFGNINNRKYEGALNGGELNVNGTRVMTNMNNQFKFKKGWGAELSGWWRSRGIEAQMIMEQMWRMDAGLSKQVLKSKGTIKLGIRDIFNSQNFNGSVNYQDIDVKIREQQYRRMGTISFSYRFGKPIKDQQPKRKTGGAADESGRVKTGGG